MNILEETVRVYMDIYIYIYIYTRLDRVIYNLNRRSVIKNPPTKLKKEINRGKYAIYLNYKWLISFVDKRLS